MSMPLRNARTRAALWGGVLWLSAVGVVSAADKKVHVDVERSLNKQDEAADAAEAEVKKGARNFKAVLLLLGDKSVQVRDAVVEELVKTWSDDDLKVLEKGFKLRQPMIVEGLAEVYELKALKFGAEAIAGALNTRWPDETNTALLRALAVVGSDKQWRDIEKLYKRSKRNFRVRGECLHALASIDPKKARKMVDEAVEDKEFGVRIMALELLARSDPKAMIKTATSFIKQSDKDREDIWSFRLLFASLDNLSALRERTPHKAELKAAIEAMIARLDKARGRAQYELGVSLTAVTGMANLAPEHFAWKSWWDVKKDVWEPKDAPKKDDKTKKKKGKKDEEEKDPGERMGSVVRFHGIPIHSLRLTFCQDVSGGMKNPVGGRDSDTPAKLVISKQELEKVLTGVDEAAYVNLLYFATFYYKCAPSPVPVKKARKALIAYNKKQDIPDKRGHGRSNLYDTIAFAISQPDIDSVYLLTEGGPTEGKYLETDRFMRHLKRLNVYYRVRVYTLLMGTSRSGAKFLEEVAKSTGAKFYDLKKLKKN